jgi:hypothetical protein
MTKGSPDPSEPAQDFMREVDSGADLYEGPSEQGPWVLVPENAIPTGRYLALRPFEPRFLIYDLRW